MIYKLAPQADGTWKYTVLHRFTGFDGAEPDANLIIDDQGNLYGTTATGGSGGFGVAFEITAAIISQAKSDAGGGESLLSNLIQTTSNVLV